jgi:hypothetical protein
LITFCKYRLIDWLVERRRKKYKRILRVSSSESKDPLNKQKLGLSDEQKKFLEQAKIQLQVQRLKEFQDLELEEMCDDIERLEDELAEKDVTITTLCKLLKEKDTIIRSLGLTPKIPPELSPRWTAADKLIEEHTLDVVSNPCK